MVRVVTIIGASARAAAASAVRAGYTVHAADMFADVDLQRSCQTIQVTDYPAGLSAVVNGSQPGGWMYTGALENYPALVHQLAANRPLWGNSAQSLRRVREPHELERALRSAGHLCPAVASDAGAIPRDGTWLRKSLRSAGGMQISPWNQHDHEPIDPVDFYFQQRVAGLSCSALYVAAAGRAVLLGITRQLIGAAWSAARGFQYCGSIGPLLGPPQTVAEFAEIGSSLANEFDLVGLFGIDAIQNEQGVWPVEVNPRYTASAEILDRAFGFQSVELHIAACQNGQLPTILNRKPHRYCGKAIVFAAREFIVDSDWTTTGPLDFPSLADIPRPGTTIEAGWPVATVFAVADREQEVLGNLQVQAARLRTLIGAGGAGHERIRGS